MNLLKEIQDIEKEIRSTKKFQRIKELLSDIKKKCEENRAEYNDEVNVYVVSSYALAISNFRNFYQSWEGGGIPKDEILENAEKLLKVLLNDLNKFGEEDFPENVFGNNFLLNSNEFLKDLENKIKEEKSHRQNGGGGGNNPPRPSNDSEINKQISSLQSQISTLEQKQSQHPNSDNSEQTKQELVRLKSELAVLKTKQNQQSNKSPKSNDLPWMAIGGGIVIIILLLIIAFLYGKNKK